MVLYRMHNGVREQMTPEQEKDHLDSIERSRKKENLIASKKEEEKQLYKNKLEKLSNKMGVDKTELSDLLKNLHQI